MQLGDRKKSVLQHLQSCQQADAKSVDGAFGEVRGTSLHTIQSTLDRLFRKGLLARTKQSHAFMYRPKVDRKSLIAILITQVTADFMQAVENSLIAAFASSSVSFNAAALDKLEALIQQQRTLCRRPQV
ncbi:MAG: BlaI/MecI/CopY family transcriptional regulator [Pseudomonadales bacterium]|jgi:predicted transcriptional regulator|nr:BlaI/MecI/CopY family transcriptional regulator [Pseudomonadales bacterium]MDP4639642.1 BlaI/MecI/CopY family transcriptional regulator [Pseudomonadales bacterium]MDP4766651.1 BlaI/MecI/CopY family transcriptional regulator [Pseudomonadales bacterium]MDP4876183.1 BlaI/MecI/CopY family transcriptional regulator [Pseudomonadales bacterium]